MSITGVPAPGYYIITPNGTDTIALVDHAGKPVFAYKAGLHANLMPYANKELSFFAGVADVSQKPGFVKLNKDLVAVDTIYPVGNMTADFHEGYSTSDTTFIILSFQSITTDLSKVVPGGLKDADLWCSVFQEISQSGRVLFEWRAYDHIPFTDATEDIDFKQGVVEPYHINAVVRDADGHFLVSFRHLDEIVKVHSGNGSVIWRFGGSKSKGNQFRFLNDTANGFVGFSHQHSVFRTKNGTLMIYDNGNLKPSPRTSRAVEYEIDEVAKTARRVWQYEPSTPLFTPTMGSVNELSNGSLLVGYGSASSVDPKVASPVGEEITRSGKSIVRINNLSSPPLNPYRLLKTTFGMTGYVRTLSASGTTTFSSGDSTTHVSVRVDAATGPTIVSVERHHYKPHNFSTSSGSFCGIPAVRWVVRMDDTTRLKGALVVSLAGVSTIESPATVNWLYRPMEGTGAFSVVNATYSESTKTWTLPTLLQGEYAVAYTGCLDPNLVSPVNGAVSVEQAPRLTWTPALFASGYQLQLARSIAFDKIDTTIDLADTSVTLGVLRNNTSFWWRIRKKTEQGFGAWSKPWKFTTEFNRPAVLSPKTTMPYTVVTPNTLCLWSSVKGADTYQLRMSSANGFRIDTLIADTSYNLSTSLPQGELIALGVMAIIDSVRSAPSDTVMFATANPAPLLVYPEPNTVISPTTTLRFIWRPVDGARSYQFTLRNAEGNTIVHEKLYTEPTCTIELPADVESYRWECFANGKYGAGTTATSPFRIAERVGLDKPTIDPGVKRVDVSSSEPMRCAWLAVAGSAEYHLQLAEEVTFVQPVVDTVISAVSLDALVPRASSLYAWRVQARAGRVISPWSDTVFLTANVTSTSPLLPISPVNGAVGVGTDGTFKYISDEAFLGYEIQVAKDPFFDAIDYKYYGFTDTMTFNNLELDTRYYWHVIGSRLSGEKTTGPTATMVVGNIIGVQDGSPVAALKLGARRCDEGILLVYKNIGSIDTPVSAAVYDILGRCLYTGGVREVNGLCIVPFTPEGATYFVVVTFWDGKTYSAIGDEISLSY